MKLTPRRFFKTIFTIPSQSLQLCLLRSALPRAAALARLQQTTTAELHQQQAWCGSVMCHRCVFWMLNAMCVSAPPRVCVCVRGWLLLSGELVPSDAAVRKPLGGGKTSLTAAEEWWSVNVKNSLIRLSTGARLLGAKMEKGRNVTLG